MRTRSQAVSPNGFQSLTTPPRRRKAVATSRVSKEERPKPQSKKRNRSSRKPRKTTTTKRKEESTGDEQHTAGPVSPAIHLETAESTSTETPAISSIESELQFSSHILFPSTSADNSTAAFTGSPRRVPEFVSAPGLHLSLQLCAIPELSHSASSAMELNSRFSHSTSHHFEITAAAVRPGRQRSTSSLRRSELPLINYLTRCPYSPVLSPESPAVPSMIGDHNPSLSEFPFYPTATCLIQTSRSSRGPQSSLAPGLTQALEPPVSPFTPVFAYNPSQSSSGRASPPYDFPHSSKLTQLTASRLAEVHSRRSSGLSQSTPASDGFSRDVPRLSSDSCQYVEVGDHSASASSHIFLQHSSALPHGSPDSIPVESGSALETLQRDTYTPGNFPVSQLTAESCQVATATVTSGQSLTIPLVTLVQPKVFPGSSHFPQPPVTLRRETSTGAQTLPKPVWGLVPQCPHCKALLTCPDGHSLQTGTSSQAISGSRYQMRGNSLTMSTDASRKRNRHGRDSSDSDSDPRSPKRRDVRTAYIARHRSRGAVPYSERCRRRAVESQGRIDKTLFRIPQLIAQNKADREAAEKEKAGNPYADEEPAWEVLRQMRADAELPAQELPQATVPPPDTPSKGWSIRDLLGSVPRSISRLIPAFPLSPKRSESTANIPPSPMEADKSTSSPTQAARNPEQSEQGQRPRDLSYSLFAPPIDRSRFLEDLLGSSQSASGVSAPAAADSWSSNVPKEAGRKRKRASPAKIPNPPGTSYGMDLRYFGYDSQSEAEDDVPIRQISLGLDSVDLFQSSRVTQTAVQGTLRSRKRVRFDTSPEDTPSKLRLRNTELQRFNPFAGSQVGSMQGASLPRGEDIFTSRDGQLHGVMALTSTPSPPILEPQQPISFIPNPTGTYSLDYDLFSDDSDEELHPMENEQFQRSESRTSSQSVVDDASRPCDPSQMSEVARGKRRAVEVEEESQQLPSIAPFPNYDDDKQNQHSDYLHVHPKESQLSNSWTQPPPPRPTPAHALLPRQPSTPVGLEVVAKLRSQAEKYKPKLPSGLRASRRYSSSPLTNSDAGDNYVGGEPEKDIQPENSSPRQTHPDARFKDALSGDGTGKFPDDTSSIKWPQQHSRAASLDNVTDIERSVNEKWANYDSDASLDEFFEGFEQFKGRGQFVTAYAGGEPQEQPVSCGERDCRVSSDHFSGDFEQFKRERETIVAYAEEAL